MNLRKKSTKHTFKNRQAVDTVDDDLFLKLYVDATIKGWTGLTLEYVSRLAPIDLDGKDPTAELAYSSENALAITKASSEFDGYVSEVISDLGNFSKSSTKT